MSKNKGFSLLEIIITLTVAAILSTGIFSMVSYIRLANTRKCVEELNTQMEKVKLRTMSSAQKPYLYLYKKTEGYYVVVSTLAVFTTALEKDASLLAGPSTTIWTTINGVSKTVQSAPICIYFSRSSGAFESPYDEILIGKKNTSKIVMVRSTGKHYIE